MAPIGFGEKCYSSSYRLPRRTRMAGVSFFISSPPLKWTLYLVSHHGRLVNGDVFDASSETQGKVGFCHFEGRLANGDVFDRSPPRRRGR